MSRNTDDNWIIGNYKTNRYREVAGVNGEDDYIEVEIYGQGEYHIGQIDKEFLDRFTERTWFALKQGKIFYMTSGKTKKFPVVELGQEKSNKELEYKFQEKIKLLTQEKDLVSQQLLTVTRNHQNILRRRKRDLYEIGNVVYIVSHDAFIQFYQDNYHNSSFKDCYLSIK